MKLAIGNNFPHAPSIKKAADFAFTPKASVNSLLGGLAASDNRILTENGAPALKSTLSALVDLFAMGGALRSRPDSEVESLFIKAFSENPLLALKLAFHIRNIRGGNGERKVFRTILRHLANNHTAVVVKNLDNIVHFGRYDDLYSLLGTNAEIATLAYLHNQLDADVAAYEQDKPISLLSKWLPSINTSSAATVALAKKICSAFSYTEKQYRKTLSALRAYSNVLEVKLSAQEWGAVDYGHIPSKAGLKYRKAFSKHDAARYVAFLAEVKAGTQKINASTLFPYEIVEKAMGYSAKSDETLDVLWDALPNYMEDSGRNILTVCDVSGSMSGRPMATSIALGIYSAQFNKGPFSGYFITYSEKPQLQKVVGANIREKIKCLTRVAAVNTNFQAVFDLLLATAVKNNVKPSDMPAQIICVTDAEWDNPQNKGKTNHETLVEKYKAHGYEVPQLVYWNVSSRQNNVPVCANQEGVLLVSGASPSVFSTLLNGKHFTPTDQMEQTLNAEMYDRVVL